MGIRVSCRKVAALCVVLLFLGGCIQTKPTPGYARAGDHITIGLGGIARNAGGEAVLTSDDLTVTLTDFSGQEYILESRFIFKVYGDYSAQYNMWTFDGTTTLAGVNGAVPYDGSWMVVLPLTTPGVYNAALPLVPGPATISVDSPKLVNTLSLVEGNLDAIPIEIIAGTSPQDVDFVQQFPAYVQTVDGFVIRPDDLTGIDEVGGAFFTIDYTNESIMFLDNDEPIVVPSNHNPYVQLNYNVISNGDGTGKILVTLLNPAGFKTLATADVNSSFLSDLSFRLNYFSAEEPSVAKANFSIDTSNSYYIGMDGDEIAGLTPVMTHSVDL